MASYMVDEFDADRQDEYNSYVPEANAVRRGVEQGDDGEDEEEKRRREERERKKAEVRARLEAAGKAKKAKKGFLTPERKKKLRKLLMMKAAEDLKQQQLLKEQERQRILAERIMALPNVDDINDSDKLLKLAKEMWERLGKVEDEKYDLEYAVRQKDFEINELTIAVNDLRGKFVKPTLKKVSKYDSKFDKMAEKSAAAADKVDFRAQLKETKIDKFAMDDVEKPKADWQKPHEGAEGAEAEE